MTGESRGPRRAFVLFLVAAIVLASTLALAGQGFARARYGDGYARAWVAGCGVSLLASLVSGFVVWLMSGSGTSGVTIALGSMLSRLVLVGLLGAGAAVIGELAARPFLLGVAASYLALLIADTAFALAVAKEPAGSL